MRLPGLLSLMLMVAGAGPGLAEVQVQAVTFDPVVMHSGHGDNWHMTWASDGHQYTVLGDGKGWNSGPEANTRVWRLEGEATSFVPTLVSGYPFVAAEERRWYGYGIVSIRGTLYHYVSHTPGPLQPFNGARLVSSADGGETWRMADGTPMNWAPADDSNMFFWKTPDQAFTLISILQYGRDYADNTDGFVYLYSPNGYSDDRMRELVLARVPSDSLLTRSRYEFYAGTTTEGSPLWSGNVEDRKPIHQFPAGWTASNLRYSWHPSVTYNRALNLYVMVAAGTGRNQGEIFNGPSYLGLYTARTPWGPWTPIHEDPNWISQGDPLTRLYEPVIAPKWISEDGRTMYLVYSDARNWPDFANLVNYSFNIQKITLTTVGEPAPRIAGLLHAATLSPGPIAPGQIITLVGEGIGPVVAVATSLNDEGRVASGIGGTRVLFDGTPGPLLYASARQVNVIAPYKIVDNPSVKIWVEVDGVASTAMEVPVTDAAPGFFNLNGSGRGLAVAQNQDSTLNTAEAPAQPGSIVTLYATGEGQTQPGGEDGKVAASELPRPRLQPVVATIGGRAARVVYAGAAPGAVAGVMQVNLEVPRETASGSLVPVILLVGSNPSPAGVGIAVGP